MFVSGASRGNVAEGLPPSGGLIIYRNNIDADLPVRLSHIYKSYTNQRLICPTKLGGWLGFLLSKIKTIFMDGIISKKSAVLFEQD